MDHLTQDEMWQLGLETEGERAIIPNKEEWESLQRLGYLLQNEDFAVWFHQHFIGLEFLPIPYEVPPDVQSWREIFKLAGFQEAV